MNRSLLIIAALAFAAGGANAQNPLDDYVLEVRGDTLVIADFFDAGGVTNTLGAVIQADTDRGNVPAGRVYLLHAGSNGAVDSGNLALYLSDAAITEQGRPLTIVGEYCGQIVQGSNPDCRPPTIAGFQDAAGNPQVATMLINDDLTLKNLHFTSAHTQGQSNWSFIEVNANGVEVRWENVLGEHNRWTWINSNDNPGTQFYVSDSYLLNATDQPSRRNGGVYDAVGVPTDVVWVENTTHVQNAGMQYKFRSYAPSRVVFNHNTFVNAAGQLFLGFGYLTNFAATNNLFVNSNYQPYYPGLDQSEMYPSGTAPSEFQPHGIINLAPLPTNDAGQTYANTTAAYPGTELFDEEDRKILVALNGAYWDDALLNIPQALNSAGVEGDVCQADACVQGDASLDWTTQAILANERTMSIVNDDATYPLVTWEEWYTAGPPNFLDGPGMVQDLVDWGYDSANSGITVAQLLPKLREVTNPAGNEIDDEDTNNWIVFDWPVAIDLAYTNETYLDGGYQGYPLGDLNWFPAQKVSWLTQRDAEYAAIQTALDTGAGFATADEGGPSSSISRLGQNQPNPFGTTTTIAFELASPSDVTLEVYDALGRRVATLVEGTLPAGPHTAQWDAGSLSSGVYVYTLRAGDTVESRRMVLAR